MGDLRFAQVKVYTRPSVSKHSIARAPLAGLEVRLPVCANVIQYTVFLTTGSENTKSGAHLRCVKYFISLVHCLHYSSVLCLQFALLELYRLLWENMPLNI